MIAGPFVLGLTRMDEVVRALADQRLGLQLLRLGLRRIEVLTRPALTDGVVILGEETRTLRILRRGARVKIEVEDRVEFLE